MDYIIIKTGFASIRHNITFRKQTQPKGENLQKLDTFEMLQSIECKVQVTELKQTWFDK